MAIATRSPGRTPNVVLQLAREAAGPSAELAVRPPLVLVDDVDERVVRVAHREHVDDRARRADEVAQRDAVDHDGLDLERRAGDRSAAAGGGRRGTRARRRDPRQSCGPWRGPPRLGRREI